jgi:hypothetical protein
MLLAGLVATGLVALPSIGQGALPTEGAFYKGKASVGGKDRRNVELKVSKSGRRLSWGGPQDGCGANPSPQFFLQIKNVKISRDGRFSKNRTYHLRLVGARGGDDGLLDVFYTYRIKLRGQFVSSRKAKGRVSTRASQHLELTSDPGHPWDIHGPSKPPGPVSEASCGKRSGRWTARLAPYSSRGILGRKQGPGGGGR